MLGNLVRVGECWVLVTGVGDHGLAVGVRVDIARSGIGKDLVEADPEDATFKALEDHPPKWGPLVDHDLFSSLLYKAGAPALFILGRIADGRHAGVLLKDGQPANGRLVPVDPDNDAYRSLMSALQAFARMSSSKSMIDAPFQAGPKR